MKRKYYMRGLGFGIVITTLVLSFVYSPEMSDEEIIKRAEELGYQKVEVDTTPGINLDELLGQGTPAPTKPLTPQPTQGTELTGTPTPEVTKEPQETITPEPTQALQVTSTPVPTPTVSPSPTEAMQETPIPEPTQSAEVKTVEINVLPGASASQVCKMLESAGIVSDWEDLRMFLVRNGLTDFIRIGTFEISSDMTYAEIASKLTGRTIE